jgi:hypothetical protein
MTLPPSSNAAGADARRAILPERWVQQLHGQPLRARKVLGWPQKCRLAHTFRWEYSYKNLKLAQLLGQRGVFLTFAAA